MWPKLIKSYIYTLNEIYIVILHDVKFVSYLTWHILCWKYNSLKIRLSPLFYKIYMHIQYFSVSSVYQESELTHKPGPLLVRSYSLMSHQSPVRSSICREHKQERWSQPASRTSLKVKGISPIFSLRVLAQLCSHHSH